MIVFYFPTPPPTPPPRVGLSAVPVRGAKPIGVKMSQKKDRNSPFHDLCASRSLIITRIIPIRAHINAAPCTRIYNNTEANARPFSHMSARISACAHMCACVSVRVHAHTAQCNIRTYVVRRFLDR